MFQYYLRLEAVKLLHTFGADIDKKGLNGGTALHKAIKEEHDSTAEYLIREAKADVNITDNDQDTPLHDATLNGLTNTVHLLCQSKAEINTKNNWGRTLHFASEHGQVSPVKMLLHLGADVNIKDIFGITAREVAGN